MMRAFVDRRKSGEPFTATDMSPPGCGGDRCRTLLSFLPPFFLIAADYLGSGDGVIFQSASAAVGEDGWGGVRCSPRYENHVNDPGAEESGRGGGQRTAHARREMGRRARDVLSASRRGARGIGRPHLLRVEFDHFPREGDVHRSGRWPPLWPARTPNFEWVIRN